MPFEYEHKVKSPDGKEQWQKVRVFRTLKEMREDYVKRKDLAPDDPFRKNMIEAIDLAIAGKIKPNEIFITALAKYEAVYGKQNLKLIRKKETK